MGNEEDEKTPIEYMAERADAWKMARSMLRGSDLTYTCEDVMCLALYLMDEEGTA